MPVSAKVQISKKISSHCITSHFLEHHQVSADTINALHEQIIHLATLLASCLRDGGTIYWCGNGGSAADCQHIAAELVGRFKKDRKPLRSIALTTDTSVLTCVGNDFGYEKIFLRQLQAIGRPGDVVVGISSSGLSNNINEMLRGAKDLSIVSVALLGKHGGLAKGLADHALMVPSQSTARIQEMHILLGHILCDLIEMELGLA
jgi:D-sedoheptulose 7-phosphate isomerase